MGSFANTIFSILLGWVQSLVYTIWNAFTTDSGGSLFTWIAKHWMILGIILCVGGVAIDLLVYVVRWRPFRVWHSFFHHRKQNMEAEDESGEYDEAVYDSGERQFAEPVSPDLPEEEPGFRADGTDSAGREPMPESAVAVMTTPAGYRVPENSPYRRPVSMSEPDPDDYTATDEIEQRIVRSGRKRRASRMMDDTGKIWPDTYSDELIDKREAYYRPVYPQGWKQQEDSGNE